MRFACCLRRSLHLTRYRSFCFEGYADHRDLLLLTHSFPSRRSSVLVRPSSVLTQARIQVQGALVAPPRSSDMCPRHSSRSGRITSRPGECSAITRSEEHTSEPPSLMRISYEVFCLKKKKTQPRSH